MEFFKANTNIPFMRQRRYAGAFSVLIMLVSLCFLCVNGLNLGLDFTGGTKAEISFKHAVDSVQIRDRFADSQFSEAVVQAYDTHHLAVRVGVHKELSQEALKARLMNLMPGATIQAMNYIGPQVGKQLMTNGILAVVVALLATIIYIALRFEYRFALSAAIALLHDPILILGVFSAFHLEFNLIVLAAVMTVIGYSLNDTIVVYDRVRENFKRLRHDAPTVVMDKSINQTLSRTIMTSSLTCFVVVSLLLFGGDYLFGFSLALLIGIVIGTYSSIYVAGSLAITFGLTRDSLLSTVKKPDNY